MSGSATNIFCFHAPNICDPYDGRDAIANSLAIHEVCAFFLAGNDEMGLADILDDRDISIEDYDPAEMYLAAVENIFDEVNGYNYFVKAIRSAQPLLSVVVDREKTDLLNNSDEYKIYRVVQDYSLRSGLSARL